MAAGVFSWLRRNAHRYGFSNAEGQRVGEDWHWAYVGGYKPKPVRSAHWFLTSEERKKYQEWRALKKANKNKARRGELWRWMIERRRNIYRAAQKSGWKKYNRKLRYRFFYNLTKNDPVTDHRNLKD
jgi:hypothetical protein